MSDGVFSAARLRFTALPDGAHGVAHILYDGSTVGFINFMPGRWRLSKDHFDVIGTKGERAKFFLPVKLEGIDANGGLSGLEPPIETRSAVQETGFEPGSEPAEWCDWDEDDDEESPPAPLPCPSFVVEGRRILPATLSRNIDGWRETVLPEIGRRLEEVTARLETAQKLLDVVLKVSAERRDRIDELKLKLAAAETRIAALSARQPERESAPEPEWHQPASVGAMGQPRTSAIYRW